MLRDLEDGPCHRVASRVIPCIVVQDIVSQSAMVSFRHLELHALFLRQKVTKQLLEPVSGGQEAWFFPLGGAIFLLKQQASDQPINRSYLAPGAGAPPGRFVYCDANAVYMKIVYL